MQGRDRHREIQAALQEPGGAREPEWSQADERQALDGVDVDART